MARPPVRYAQAGDVNVAYQVLGDGPPDLVQIAGLISHRDLDWDSPILAASYERLAGFARLITFDKRGMGLSDPVEGVPSLETRMQDLIAVMDAVGVEHAHIQGASEGAAMACLFAATYPERVDSLILISGTARPTWAPNYTFANRAEDLMQGSMEWVAPYWGTGASVETFCPSGVGDPEIEEWYGRIERMGASPGMILKLFQMYLEVDVRDVLPAISAPTLVVHRTGDLVVNVRHGRYLAEHIPNARLVELEGRDHSPMRSSDIVDEIERWITGSVARPEPTRRLATVMFTDIVGSTERAAAMGDGPWRELLTRHDSLVRAVLARFDGDEVKQLGDGFLATFDGPARAVEAGRAIVGDLAGAGIDVRVGVHTGECEVIANDIGGIAVHIASRVGALAGAGEVLVSRTVKDLVAGSGLAFDERGTHQLKGIPDDWQLYAVTP